MIAAVLGTATCCPTLFLVAEKGKSAPRLWLPEAVIDTKGDPIPQPAQIENRFLLDHGKETNQYSDYNDIRDLSLTAQMRAMNALREIKAHLRVRSYDAGDLEYKWVDGTLQCGSGSDSGSGSGSASASASETCGSIQLKEGFGDPQFYRAIEIAPASPGSGRGSRVDEVTNCVESNSTTGSGNASQNEASAHSTKGPDTLQECKPDGVDTAGTDSTTGGGNSSDTAAQRDKFCVCKVEPKGILQLKAGISLAKNDSKDVKVLLHMPGSSFQGLSTPLFTFIHITDVQVRDPAVLVGGRSMSHKLDWLVQSFEYSADLEFNDLALGEAIVATINEEVKRKPSNAESPKEEIPNVRIAMEKLSIPDIHELESSMADVSMAEMSKEKVSMEDASMRESHRKQGDKNRQKDEDYADRPQFVIHTGDAIDSGVNTELRDFHRLIDRLEIPTYNVIGSHDVMAFGNLMPTRSRHSDKECATAESVMEGKILLTRNHPWWFKKLLPNKLCIYAVIKCEGCGPEDIQFVAAGKRGEPITHANARKSFIGAFEHHDYDNVPQPPLTRPKTPGGDSPLVPPNKNVNCERISPYRPSRQHGFDLNREAPESGYYAFSSRLNISGGVEGKPRKLVSIVLNTEDFVDDGRPVSAGVLGHVGKLQVQWLRDTLSCTDPTDLVLVFGHVALSDIAPADKGQPTGDLLEVLNAQKNLIAYFYGHGHEHQICGDHKRSDACSKFWEVATASLLEFPQEARRVKIKDVGDGLGFLELVAFRERLEGRDERTTAIKTARTAGERDWCYSTPSATCENNHVQRTDGHDANARLWFLLPGD